MQPNHTINQVITKQATICDLRFNTDQSHISLQLANGQTVDFGSEDNTNIFLNKKIQIMRNSRAMWSKTSIISFLF